MTAGEREIVLGVTGSVAAYKAAELARLFVRRGIGVTAVLTASALVGWGETYNIKVAVADAGDNILDSGVFIEAGSFSSPNAIDSVSKKAASMSSSQKCEMLRKEPQTKLVEM